MGGQPAHFYRGIESLRYPDMRIKSSQVLLPALELQRTHDHLSIDLLEIVNRRRVLDLAVSRRLSVFACLCAF